MGRFFAIFALGAFSSLSMAPTNFWPSLFIGLSGLYIFLLRAKTPSSCAVIGFLYSLGYFGFSLSWIGNALLVEDNPYWWAWPLSISGLPALLSLFTASGCYGYKILCRNLNNFSCYISFTICILLSEYARGYFFTGFPWNLYGYTWIDVLPIAQLASISDIYLVTMMTIFWASAPAFLFTSQYTKTKKLFLSSIIIISFGLVYIYGEYRLRYYPTQYYEKYEAIIVQPNIKQSEKWRQKNRAANFIKQIELSEYNEKKNSSDKFYYYIVWPETAISQDLINTPWAMNAISKMLKGYPSDAYLITGALRYEKDTKNYYNSIITLNSAAEILHTYDKSHLVPFGEYIPFENIFDIAPIVGFTGFKKGAGQTTQQINDDGIKFSPLICYEIIFPGKTVDYTKPKPDFLINVTNDAWYGNSPGPYQHLVQAKFRAIETGVPVLRSANTGISAVISSLGEEINSGDLSTEVSLIQNLPVSIAKNKLNYPSGRIILLLLITLLFSINVSRVLKL